MAHFAELDKNNIVQQVIVVGNEDVKEAGVETESKGVTFCKNLLGLGKAWVQTSYNGSIRKQYAGIGMTYDSVKDKFILPQPYPSWALDDNDDWQAPTPMPEIVGDERYSWNEEAQSWDEII
jgi:hypothetical protein